MKASNALVVAGTLTVFLWKVGVPGLPGDSADPPHEYQPDQTPIAQRDVPTYTTSASSGMTARPSAVYVEPTGGQGIFRFNDGQ